MLAGCLRARARARHARDPLEAFTDPRQAAGVFEAVAAVLRQEPSVAYAIVFGSSARGTSHRNSDLDVAVGLTRRLDVRQLGDLIGRLESASGCPVDLVSMDEASIALAYRIFRDGVVIFERDRPALVERKARAVLEYLDFKPIEDICTRGVLAAAKRG